MRKFAATTTAAFALALAAPVTAAAAGLPQAAAAKGSMISMTEITLLLFTITNSLRVVAYLPQIWKAATTDPHGARGISCVTWSLFLVSNLATAGYAVVNLNDWTMAAVFLANAVGCTAIIGFSVGRRIIRRRKPP